MVSSQGLTSMIIMDLESLALAAPRALASAMMRFFSSAAACSSGVTSPKKSMSCAITAAGSNAAGRLESMNSKTQDVRLGLAFKSRIEHHNRVAAKDLIGRMLTDREDTRC